MRKILITLAALGLSVLPTYADVDGVQKLIEQVRDANGRCRGSGDDAACGLRDELTAKLYDLGWCYGKPHQAMYEMEWHQCTLPLPTWAADAQRISVSARPESEYIFDGIEASLTIPLHLEGHLGTLISFNCRKTHDSFGFVIKPHLSVRSGAVTVYKRSTGLSTGFREHFFTSEIADGSMVVGVLTETAPISELLEELHGGGEFLFRFEGHDGEAVISLGIEPTREMKNDIGSMYQMCELLSHRR